MFCSVLFCSAPFFNRRRSEGWPHHRRTFSIYLCPLSFWLTFLRIVLSTHWCGSSRPYEVFLACINLTLFLALSLSWGNFLVSSWCDHSTLASLLWECLIVPSLLPFVKNPLICFLCCPRNPQNLSQFLSEMRQDVFLHSFWVSSVMSKTKTALV